jgi:hypothetical protein
MRVTDVGCPPEWQIICALSVQDWRSQAHCCIKLGSDAFFPRHIPECNPCTRDPPWYCKMLTGNPESRCFHQMKNAVFPSVLFHVFRGHAGKGGSACWRIALCASTTWLWDFSAFHPLRLVRVDSSDHYAIVLWKQETAWSHWEQCRGSGLCDEVSDYGRLWRVDGVLHKLGL